MVYSDGESVHFAAGKTYIIIFFRYVAVSFCPMKFFSLTAFAYSRRLSVVAAFFWILPVSSLDFFLSCILCALIIARDVTHIVPTLANIVEAENPPFLS